jgi:hypothetical protein
MILQIATALAIGIYVVLSKHAHASASLASRFRRPNLAASPRHLPNFPVNGDPSFTGNSVPFAEYRVNTSIIALKISP